MTQRTDQWRRKGGRRWAAVALLAALALGCAEGRSGEGRGGVRVSLAVAAVDPLVSEVVVTIRPGDGPGFEPIVTQLSQAAGGWTAAVSGVPAGPGRVTEVVALGPGRTPRYAGSGKADILAGAVAELVVQLAPEVPAVPGVNGAPVIDFVSASQGAVAPGRSIRLEAGAHDPDPYDTISLAWTATCGAFDAPGRSVVVWRAPTVEGTCLVLLTVSDDQGGSSAVYLPIAVAIPAP